MRITQRNQKVTIYNKKKQKDDIGAITSYIGDRICTVWANVKNNQEVTDDGEKKFIKNEMVLNVRSRPDITQNNVVVIMGKEHEIYYIDRDKKITEMDIYVEALF